MGGPDLLPGSPIGGSQREGEQGGLRGIRAGVMGQGALLEKSLELSS